MGYNPNQTIKQTIKINTAIEILVTSISLLKVFCYNKLKENNKKKNKEELLNTLNKIHQLDETLRFIQNNGELKEEFEGIINKIHFMRGLK